jgi:uncharacterized protein
MAEGELRTRLAASPAVAVVGPRQCGKTTLARMLGGVYFDLEQEADRLRLDLEWQRRVQSRELLVLDEAQTWPELFARLRGAIDAERRRNGRFLLLGSVSPALMTHVSESLAGRLSLLELTPFLQTELTAPAQKRQWLCGGFPDGGVLRAEQYPRWERDYLTLLAQRDLPQWGLPAKPQVIERFLRMIATVHGQQWNASQIGSALGLDAKTVSGYLDYLAGAFLVRKLPSFQANLRKRVVKAPKIYWRDSGLLHAILNIVDENTLLSQPWVGASWEGFVIEQVLGVLAARGRDRGAYFLRTSDGYELDLVLETGEGNWAIEVKLTASPTIGDLERLNRTADLIGAKRRFLVSNTSAMAGDEHCLSCNLPQLLSQLG